MSSKSNPPAHSGAKHAAHGEHVSSEELDHQDDLIVAPKGANRTRFILTVILVLFVLVMFVVADLFQYVVGGSSRGGQNPTYVTWRDPVQGADESVNAMDFELTRRLLSQLAYMGLYQPDSYAYSERASRRAAPDVTEADVASFLVFEDLAKDAGITTSEKEHRDLLLARFQSGANLVATAREFQMTAKQLEDAIRRVRSVEKLKEFMRTGTRLADPDAMLESWQSQHQQHKFQYTALSTDAFAADAAAETLPDDEALLTWWRTRPPFEQQQLWSEEKTIPQVAWLDLSGSFDATALLEAFPRPEGLDETQLARTYYDRYRAVRFLDPTPPPTEPGDDTPDDADKPSPYLEFEAVQEDALREARVEASLVDFLADLKERTDKGEESIDLAVEAAKYGLESYTSPDAMTRAELAAALVGATRTSPSAWPLARRARSSRASSSMARGCTSGASSSAPSARSSRSTPFVPRSTRSGSQSVRSSSRKRARRRSSRRWPRSRRPSRAPRTRTACGTPSSTRRPSAASSPRRGSKSSSATGSSAKRSPAATPR
ncbi:MAG: hypothetical protein R3F49_17030 [Planctomycetota bacterium]